MSQESCPSSRHACMHARVITRTKSRDALGQIQVQKVITYEDFDMEGLEKEQTIKWLERDIKFDQGTWRYITGYFLHEVKVKIGDSPEYKDSYLKMFRSQLFMVDLKNLATQRVTITELYMKECRFFVKDKVTRLSEEEALAVKNVYPWIMEKIGDVYYTNIQAK